MKGKHGLSTMIKIMGRKLRSSIVSIMVIFSNVIYVKIIHLCKSVISYLGCIINPMSESTINIEQVTILYIHASEDKIT